MTLNHAKTQSLLAAINFDHPAFAALRESPDPAGALLGHFARPSRPHYRFAYARKAEILAFLRTNYGAWRAFDETAAQQLVHLSIPAAQGARALADIAELGKAWWATGDPAYGAAFERFYRATPTGEMFNWGAFNGIQGALELEAWFLLLDCPGFSREGRIAFLDHLRAIADNAWDDNTSQWSPLGLGPEGHNWYLHGARVLPQLGLLFPEFRRADFLLRSGAGIFEEHLRGHYKADGGARETTLAYQAGSLMNLWEFYLLAQRNDYPLSAGFADRLLSATRFLLKLMSPSGGLPSFGDGAHTPGDLTELAAVAAALTGDGACKGYAERSRRHLPGNATEAPGEIPLRAFWTVGLEGARAYAATPARDPELVSVLLGPTGYAALRNADTADAHYLAIAAADRGPMVTSHGHNDVFAVEVHALGTRFVGEMGCADYGDTPARRYDESTAAHSCLTIDGMEQAPLASEWRWRGHVLPAVRRWISEPTHDFFHGVHEGFYHYPEQNTLHARKVFFIKSAPSYWVVLDWLLSDVEHDVSVYWHGCVPGMLDDTTILLGQDTGPRLAILPPQGDAVRGDTVVSDGLSAYICQKQLDPAAYPCFAYRIRTASDCLCWVMAPLRPGEAPPRVERLPVTLNGASAPAHRATAVRIIGRDCVDTLCVSHTDYNAQLDAGGISLWGMLGFARANASGARHLEIQHTVADGSCGR